MHTREVTGWRRSPTANRAFKTALRPPRPAAAATGILIDQVTELELLDRHAAVLFDMDPAGRLVGVNEPGGERPPRMFLARGHTTHRIWFRADVPEALSDACRDAAYALPSWDGEPTDPQLFEPFRTIFDADQAGDPPSIGPAYRFAASRALRDGPGAASTSLIDERSAHLLERFFPYTREVLAARHPVAAVVMDGWAVSACFSARRRPVACEAGVATAEPYQGRGLAGLVVSCWREALEQAGTEPLYSTSWDNSASRALARKLGLIMYAETFALG